CLGPLTRTWYPCPEMTSTPAALVRHGHTYAEVDATVWFADDELAAVRELYEGLDWPHGRQVEFCHEVRVHWRFPDPKGDGAWGISWCEPAGAEALFRARATAARFAHAPVAGWALTDRLGGVFRLDMSDPQMAGPVVPGARGRNVVGTGKTNGPAKAGRRREAGLGLRSALIDLATRAQ